MGGWKLEAFRMSLYVMFPVAMFDLFNRPEYFESSVVKTKREYCPPEDLVGHMKIENMKAEFRKKREKLIEEEFSKLL